MASLRVQESVPLVVQYEKRKEASQPREICEKLLVEIGEKVVNRSSQLGWVVIRAVVSYPRGFVREKEQLASSAL